MNKLTIFCSLLIMGLCACNNARLSESYKTIRALNQRMEMVYEEEAAAGLADFYAPDARMIGPDDQLEGKAAIRKFWSRIDHPVNLDFKVLGLTNRLDSLNNSAYWQQIVRTAGNWPGILEAENQQNHQYIFQLIQLTLEYEREDVTYFTNEAVFLWVWAKEEEGYYRITLDIHLASQ